jgi:hypothetical protein
MPRDVADLLSCWSGKFGRAEARVIWKEVPHCLTWCLGHERNTRTFTGDEKSTPTLKFYILQTLFDWLKASNIIMSSSLSEMLICVFCIPFVYTSCVHGLLPFLIN